VDRTAAIASKERGIAVPPLGGLARRPLADGVAERVRTWVFNAPEDYGHAVASEFIVPVRFSIKGYTPPTTTEPVSPHAAKARVLDTVTVEGK
jgi:hypothetical protein